MKDKDINKGEKTLKRSELLLMTSFYQHRYNNFQESGKKRERQKGKNNTFIKRHENA